MKLRKFVFLEQNLIFHYLKDFFSLDLFYSLEFRQDLKNFKCVFLGIKCFFFKMYSSHSNHVWTGFSMIYHSIQFDDYSWLLILVEKQKSLLAQIFRSKLDPKSKISNRFFNEFQWVFFKWVEFSESFWSHLSHDWKSFLMIFYSTHFDDFRKLNFAWKT